MEIKLLSGFKGLSKFPRYKKEEARCEVLLSENNKTDWTVERHRVKVPTIGWIRLKEYGYISKIQL